MRSRLPCWSPRIGRIGNYFNKELFGGPTHLPWGLGIPLAYRPPGYTAYELEHGTRDPETNVTGDDVIMTAKIARAHLNEFPA